MPILTLIIIICLVGGALWVVNRYIPMEPTIKQILNVVVIIALIIWLLKVFGLFDSLSTVTV